MYPETLRSRHSDGAALHVVTGLPRADRRGHSDPYVIVQVALLRFQKKIASYSSIDSASLCFRFQAEVGREQRRQLGPCICCFNTASMLRTSLPSWIFPQLVTRLSELCPGVSIFLAFCAHPAEPTASCMLCFEVAPGGTISRSLSECMRIKCCAALFNWALGRKGSLFAGSCSSVLSLAGLTD